MQIAWWIFQSTDIALLSVAGNVYSLETGDSNVDSRITMYSENWFAPRRGASYVEFQVKLLFCIKILGKNIRKETSLWSVLTINTADRHFIFQISVCLNAHIALGLDPTTFDSDVYEVSLAYKSGSVYHDVVFRDGVNGNVGEQTPG